MHNELPDCVVPFKHYNGGLIEDVIDEKIGVNDIETEDYPCEATMNHWKGWMRANVSVIIGQMEKIKKKQLLDFAMLFPKFREASLMEQTEKQREGWLSVVTRFIYNTGNKISMCNDSAPTFVLKKQMNMIE